MIIEFEYGEGFLNAELERCRDQLEGYRDALEALGGGPVRAALYFPLLPAFRELPPNP